MSSDDWTFFRDKADEWRWRRTNPNGEIVAASTEGYVNRPECVYNATLSGFLEAIAKTETGE
jgi:uncharacterized protein YegP (UPF0339 family)